MSSTVKHGGQLRHGHADWDMSSSRRLIDHGVAQHHRRHMSGWRGSCENEILALLVECKKVESTAPRYVESKADKDFTCGFLLNISDGACS